MLEAEAVHFIREVVAELERPVVLLLLAERAFRPMPLPFPVMHVATARAECEKRDPKGLHARARSGELKGLTGVDAAYEPPENPDLVVLDTTGADIDDLVAQVIALLDERSARPSSP